MGNFGSRGGAPPPPRPPPPPPPALQAHLHGVRPPYYHRYPGWPPGTAPLPPPLGVPASVERHRTVAVHAGVNIKGDTLRLEPDDDGRGLLLAFSFDADAPGRSPLLLFFSLSPPQSILAQFLESQFLEYQFLDQFELSKWRCRANRLAFYLGIRNNEQNHGSLDHGMCPFFIEEIVHLD